MATDIRVVFTTAADEAQAIDIAQGLVTRRLAACVNICPGLRSIYRWQGKIWDDEEFMLVIKTQAERLEQVKATIKEIHSYELPEMLALEVVEGSGKVLDWIREMTRSGEAGKEGGG